MTTDSQKAALDAETREIIAGLDGNFSFDLDARGVTLLVEQNPRVVTSYEQLQSMRSNHERIRDYFVRNRTELNQRHGRIGPAAAYTGPKTLDTMTDQELIIEGNRIREQNRAAR